MRRNETAGMWQGSDDSTHPNRWEGAIGRAHRCHEPDGSRPMTAQKHLRWTMSGPFSSYSALEIHICPITCARGGV